MDIKSLLRYAQDNPLGRRVLAAILICSTCLAFMATGFQLLFDYHHDVSTVEARLDEIQHSYLESIGASIWGMEDAQTRKQIEGIAKLPDVAFVQLKDPAGLVVFEIGNQISSKSMTREMPIKFIADQSTKQEIALGTLVVTTDVQKIYRDLGKKALVILATQTTKTMFVAMFALFIFNHLVSRHLSALAAYARQLDINNLGHALTLSRKQPTCADELDVVVSAINGMALSIKHDFEELEKYRTGLEILVASRTCELAQKVSEMAIVIQKLNREISDRELAERAVRENEERYRQVVEMSPDAIMIERDGKIVFANNGTLKMLGANDLKQILGVPLIDFMPLELNEIVNEHMQKLLSNEKEVRPFEGKIVRFDRTTIDVEISRSLFRYDGMPAVQTVVHDITKHKHYEETLLKQALHDGLTGLPNRRLLMDRLEQAISTADRHQHSIYVLFFDLDHFKYINDTLGHDAGDELLKTITFRMSDCMRSSDTLARLGGDEFVLLLGNEIDIDCMNELVQRIMNRVSEPMLLGDQEVTISCSIGMSVYPQDGADAMTLLKYADTAMYRAKELGRNGIQRYNAEMNARVSEHLAMESRLRHALAREEFRLHYQPLVDLRTGRITGAEALIRWQHPELGLLMPSRFIPLAEETGLIVSIGEWVMRTACAQAKLWHEAGFLSLRISINLSAQQLHPGLEMKLKQILEEVKLPARFVELEMTESMSMDDPENTLLVLNEFKRMGCSIAIDDFGTGYSNLTYLKRFPVDKLKLDRSFLLDVADEESSGMANAIVSMAHALNLKIVAEGVEDLVQLEQLVTYGCDEIQGCYFSSPVPADDFMKMLHERRSLHLNDSIMQQKVPDFLLVSYS